MSRLATIRGKRRGGIFIEIASATGESSSDVGSSESESESSSAESQVASSSSSSESSSDSSSSDSGDSSEDQSSGESDSDDQSSVESESEEESSADEAPPSVNESVSDGAAPSKRANEFDDIDELLGRLRKKSRTAFQQDSECSMEADVDELHKRFWNMSSVVTKLRDVTAMLVSS